MFADVVLPLPLAGTFTYAIPPEMEERIGIGFRAIVPFGKRKLYTAIVLKLHEKAPAGVAVKEIHSLVDSFPAVNERQIRLWEWISFYYLSTLGDVYKAAMPSKLKLESETFLRLIKTDGANTSLNPTEEKVVALLRETDSLTISTIEKKLRTRNLLPHLYSLLFKNVIDIREDIRLKYKPKTATFIALNADVQDGESVIGRAPKQIRLYRELKRLFSEEKREQILKKEIIDKTGFTNAVLNGLIDKKLLIQFCEEISRISANVEPCRHPFVLTSSQQEAFQEINRGFERKNVCLLHGVTSSGKTEIYIHLIEQCVKRGEQTLYLVPEIALTTQLTSRLRAVFGNKLAIYHSKINDSERAEIWQKMLSDTPYEIVIGARSALFLPFRKLGLVVVDEEHEPSYKQQEPAPRYHARDTAIVLAQLFGAKTLLGSATPSIESFYNARSGKFGRVVLDKRFEEIELPKIVFENTYELRRRKKMKSSLAPALIQQMHRAFENGRQVILFRNRRGFAPMLECKRCGWTPKCRRCDVALTLHQKSNELKCHYCNKAYKPVYECPVCRENSVGRIGMGTEKLEEEISELFPDKTVARMDSDTTRGKNSYERILSDFQNRKTDILVGTQMLSKGLDFDNVSIVGIISADGLLNHPDFRSHERAFQLMMQAAGRAGRKKEQGTVIIQTADPEQPIYRFVGRNDFEGFFNLQLAERKLFDYPPFRRLICVVFKHKEEDKAESSAALFAHLLKQSLGHRVLGPNKPVVGRIQRYHIREVLLKLETDLSLSRVRELIKFAEHRLREKSEHKYTVIYYDVDRV